MDQDRSLREFYGVAGRVWELKTNTAQLLDAARQALPAGGALSACATADICLSISVSARDDRGAWASPVCRGRDHLVFCQLSDCSALVYDTSSRRVIGEVTPAVAADTALWRNIIFPFALGVMAPVLDTVPLHAGCFLHHGRGVLVGARSGAGKSTLMATLARRGFTYVSDDWVYLVSRPDSRVFALPVPLKLLPDASAFFPELVGMQPSRAENGEVSFAIDPGQAFAATRAFDCVPQTVILFDRIDGAPLHVRRATAKDLTDWFCESLDCVPECLNDLRNHQLEIIRSLQKCSCFVVTASGSPDVIADAILKVATGSVEAEPPLYGADASRIEHLDLLRRGVSTPYSATVSVGDEMAEIFTDHLRLLGQFRSEPPDAASWRMQVITERDASAASQDFCWVREHLGFASFAGEGAIAYDYSRRNAAAFFTPSSLADGRFARRLATLVGVSSFAAAGGAR